MLNSNSQEVYLKMEGFVNSYSEQKGFGFITQDDGKEVAFYRSSILMDGYRRLNGGDRVLFDIQETPRGPEAKKHKKNRRGWGLYPLIEGSHGQTVSLTQCLNCSVGGNRLLT